jgi:hypothetical protein
MTLALSKNLIALTGKIYYTQLSERNFRADPAIYWNLGSAKTVIM